MSQKITVSFVNPPREGKKQWTIKTKDNRIFGVNAGEQEQFTAGQTYEIESTAREYNGKTYHTVTSTKLLATPENSYPNGTQVRSNVTGSTSDQIRWQTCLKVAGQVHSSTESDVVRVLEFARKLFAADPIVEAAKEIFNATETPASDDAPGDW